MDQLGQQIAEPCQSVARYDVLYRLRTEQDPRGARLCLTHFEELKALKMRNLIADWDVRTLRE